MTDEYVVDTMGDDILGPMELQNGKIYDDCDSRCGEEHDMDNDTYSLYGDIE